MHSLVFFGGIILGLIVVAAGALALWGPENDIDRRREAGAPSYASAAAAADSALAALSAEPPPTVLPEAPAPDPAPEPPPAKKGKKRGGRPGARKP